MSDRFPVMGIASSPLFLGGGVDCGGMWCGRHRLMYQHAHFFYSLSHTRAHTIPEKNPPEFTPRPKKEGARRRRRRRRGKNRGRFITSFPPPFPFLCCSPRPFEQKEVRRGGERGGVRGSINSPEKRGEKKRDRRTGEKEEEQEQFIVRSTSQDCNLS